jgi:hypothetical protein
MSHFIICSGPIITLGMPKGQASSQFEQAMQRGLSDDWTTPSSVFLIASAGQTWAQVGVVAVHAHGGHGGGGGMPVDEVEVDHRGAAVVSHSAQALTQLSQPMQREGSM